MRRRRKNTQRLPQSVRNWTTRNPTTNDYSVQFQLPSNFHTRLDSFLYITSMLDHVTDCVVCVRLYSTLCCDNVTVAYIDHRKGIHSVIQLHKKEVLCV